MTSKISFTKLTAGSIRRRGWFLLLSTGAFFLMMPVYGLLFLSSMRDSTNAYLDSLASIQWQFAGIFNGWTSRYFVAVPAGLSVLAALTGFDFIHSREKLDFYHSFPVKREKWFAVSYVSGLVLLLAPYLVCALLTCAIGAADGVLTAGSAPDCALAAAGGILAMFVLYNACVFAVMLTGRAVTGVLASGAVIVYPYLLLGVFSSLQDTFFKTCFEPSGSFALRLAMRISPAGLFASLVRSSSFGSISPTLLGCTLVLSALFAAGALILYRLYPSEAAGNPLAFPVTAPVIKILLCIPLSVFAGLLFVQMMAVEEELWLLPLSVLFAVILCAVIEFICHPDIRMLFKNWKSSLIAVAAAAAFVCVFQFDVTGYDTYLPDRDKIESISIRPDSFTGYFSYPSDRTVSDTYPSESDLGHFAPPEDTDALYALAENGIENLKNGVNTANLYSGDVNSEGYVSVLFRYRLSGGRTVMRQYAVSAGQAEQALTKLLENEDYRRDLFPIFQINREEVLDVSVYNIYGQLTASGREGTLTKAQQDALLDAYEKDVLAADAGLFLKGAPCGELYIDIPDPYEQDADSSYTQDAADTAVLSSGQEARRSDTPSYCVNQFYLYPEYTNTMALLKEYGCVPENRIPAEDVSSISVNLLPETVQDAGYQKLAASLSDSAVTEDYDEQIYISSSDPDDISRILDFVPDYTVGLLMEDGTPKNYVDIQYKDGTGFGSAF